MSKVKELFSNLKKSTRITLISCGCFVALTILILVFFILCPITPSENVIASFGREKVNNSSSDTAATTTAVTIDASETTTVSADSNEISTNTTRDKNFVLTITTGSGFLSGGIIPTGVYDGNHVVSPTSATVAGDEFDDDPIGYPISPIDPDTNEPITTAVPIEDPTIPDETSATEPPNDVPVVSTTANENQEPVTTGSAGGETPTNAPTEPPTDAPTVPPTEPPTQATQPVTEPPTEPQKPTEAPTAAPQPEKPKPEA